MIIIALVVVLIVVLAGKPGGNAGNNGGNVGASSGSKGNSNAGGDVKVEVPKNASNEEKLAYNYIEFTMEFWQKGMEYDEAGLSYVADSFFAMAAANTCSMRYAIDCILELKGSPPANDERLRDWEAIAALGWASPFPYFFEGVVLEAKGDGGGANECYRKAALNPNFLEGMENFKTIKDLDEKALKSLKATLEELEDKIFETTVYEQFIFIPRDENNFSVDYLREKAMACLEAETEDLVGAYDYYLAAVLANPFDGDSYAQLAVVCLYLDKGDLFAGCINAGLAVNPKNERLGFLQDLMRR